MAATSTTTTDSVDTPAADFGQDRGRTLSGLSFVHLRSGSAKAKKNGKREIKPSLMNFFGDSLRSFR